MRNKYKLLILDNDDTLVKSTPCINYPAFVELLKELRPNLNFTFDEFNQICYQPGYFNYCRDVLKFTKEEWDRDFELWGKYMTTIIPDIYEGMREIIYDFKNNGGIICVITHSKSEYVSRDYMHHIGFLPDDIYGIECGEELIKPNTGAAELIMNKYNLTKDDILMVDDMKPGLLMSKKVGNKFAAAGWSISNPEIIKDLKNSSDFYLETTNDLRNILFED